MWGGVGKMIFSGNDIALEAETPHRCVCKPYSDNLSIQVLEDVVMTLCFAGCRYQAPECTDH